MTLGFVARALVQALAAHLLVSTVLSLAVAALWPVVAGRRAPASVVARRLFRLRMAPTVAGLTTSMLVLVAYRLWEARVDAEPVGPIALAAASGGLMLMGLAGFRVVLSLRHTWQVQRALVRSSERALAGLPIPAFVVESRFPVVALVGLVMSRLFVARRVLEVCTADEFRAVVAHEQAHVRARDNLRRLAITAAPDVMSLLPTGHRLQEAWTTVAELAADQWAAARTASGLPLASALVKVARLATMPAGPMTASALYWGEGITERVHRLLEPPLEPVGRGWPLWARALAPALLLASALLWLPALHAAAEQFLKLGL